MSDDPSALHVPRDDDRTRLIWSNILEALDNDSISAMDAAQDFAEQSEDPIGELLLLFTATAGLLGRCLQRYLGPDATRQLIHLTLFENDMAPSTDEVEP